MKNLFVLMVIPNYQQGTKNYDSYFPLGIPYVVAIIEKAGYEVDVLNLNFVEGTGKKEIAEYLKKKRYDLVGTGGSVFDFHSIQAIFDVVKSFDPNIITLLGGRILLYDSKLIFAELNADYGVIGDADITLPALLDKITQQSDIQIDNIIYRNGSRILETPRQSNHLLIDTMPYPNIVKCGYASTVEDKSSINHYFHFIEGASKSYSIVSSFNCVNKCTFCANFSTMFRRRTVENIVQEMEFAIENYQVDSFNFATDIFSVNWSNIEQLCNDIKALSIKYGKDIRFVIPMIMKGFTAEKALLLKESGCNCVFFGFESYDDNVLKSMRKGITPSDIEHVVRICRSVNLSYSGCFIFGDVAETKESYLRTLEYWRKYGRGFIALTPVCVLPGTQLMNYCTTNGLIKDKLEYYKKMSRKQGVYFLLSQKLSPHMTCREHRQMLNTLLSHILKFQLFSKCIESKFNTLNQSYNIQYCCSNCSNENRRDNVYFSYGGMLSMLTCPHCGAMNYIYRLPSTVFHLMINAGAFLLQHAGMSMMKVHYLIKTLIRKIKHLQNK